MSQSRDHRLRRRSAMPPIGVMLLLVVIATGCLGGDSASPVATVTAQLDRDIVPLGGPARLAVQFVVSPAHEPLGEDYRVMVHFLDSNGEMMWAADHDPPTPTSQWRPGQTISYSHRLRIPMYPYIGEAVVAVGLYSATSGHRLPLAGEDLGQRAYRGPTVTLEPQSESSFLVYQDGWYDDELDADSNDQWRWTAGRARLSFRNPTSDAVLYLELDGRPDLFDPPQHVTLWLDDAVIYETSVDTAGRQFHEIPLQAAQLGDDETVTIDIEVDRTFVPAEVPGAPPGDERTLGVRVFYAFLEPR